jgi:hypothetical protein
MDFKQPSSARLIDVHDFPIGLIDIELSTPPAELVGDTAVVLLQAGTARRGFEGGPWPAESRGTAHPAARARRTRHPSRPPTCWRGKYSKLGFSFHTI